MKWILMTLAVSLVLPASVDANEISKSDELRSYQVAHNSAAWHKKHGKKKQMEQVRDIRDEAALACNGKNGYLYTKCLREYEQSQFGKRGTKQIFSKKVKNFEKERNIRERSYAECQTLNGFLRQNCIRESEDHQKRRPHVKQVFSKKTKSKTQMERTRDMRDAAAQACTNKNGFLYNKCLRDYIATSGNPRRSSY